MARVMDILVNLSPTVSLLLRISAVLAAAWLIHGILVATKCNPHWRVFLWRAVMVGVVLTPFAQGTVQWQVPVAPSAPTASVQAPMPVPRLAAVPAAPPQIVPTRTATPAAGALPAVPALVAPKPNFSALLWARKHMRSVIMTLWLLVAAVMALRCLALLGRIRRLRHESSPAGPAVQLLSDRVAEELGCPHGAAVRFSAGLPSPFLMGLWHPMIVLPKRMSGPEYRDDLLGILAHEMAHLRARDLYWMLLAKTLSTLFWFHPLAWRLGAAHGAACEEVCDAVAADYVGNAASYSSSLARVALDILGPVLSIGGIAMARSPQIIGRLRQLQRGVQNIPIPRRRLLLWTILGAGALAALCGVRLVYAADATRAEKTYTVNVEGTVTDGATGKPVSGANVRGWVCQVDLRPDRAERSAQQTVKTDADGRYRFSLQSPLTMTGQYKGQDIVALTVSAAGYGTRPVFLRENVTPTKLIFTGGEVKLGPGRKISGRIVDEKHLPVAGASVAVRDGMSGGWDDWEAWGGATSADNGQFEIWLNREKPKDMANDPWLTAVKLGQGTAVQWDILQKDDLGDIVLRSGATITGKVVDEKGQPVPSCTVDAFKFPFERVGRVQTDANGVWEMKGLPGKAALRDFFQRKNKDFMPSWGQVDFYVRSNAQQWLADRPDRSLALEEGKTTTTPDIVPGAQAAQEIAEAAARRPEPIDITKAELMGRVEDFFMHNYRDITARKSLEWSAVTKDADGNAVIHYQYLATIWDKDKMICENIFTFDGKGNFVSVTNAEGYPRKVQPVPVDTATTTGLKALVEDFFSSNFRDITARKPLEWGEREAKDNGNVSIRYKYEATIGGKDKTIMNQVFTFTSKGEYVSVENVKGFPQIEEE